MAWPVRCPTGGSARRAPGAGGPPGQDLPQSASADGTPPYGRSPRVRQNFVCNPGVRGHLLGPLSTAATGGTVQNGPTQIPHISLGFTSPVGLKGEEAAPFKTIAVHPASIAVCQLGNHGHARKESTSGKM